jgi:sodium transport system permease protein
MKGTLLICKKEFLELSKDRRTLFFSFVLPILLYPVVFFIMASLGRNDQTQREGQPSRVQIVDPSQIVEPWLKSDPKLFECSDGRPANLQQAFKDHTLDLAIEVEASAGARVKRQEPYRIRVWLDESEPASELALQRMRDAVKELDKRQVSERLGALGASLQIIEPSRILTENVADPGLALGKLLGSFLPYILMLMMFQGAMQHGIYVTAGEKERGTLQSLLATSLPRSQIIWGKLIYIFCMGLIAAVLNLLSMGISLGLVLGRVAEHPAGSAGLASAHLAAMTSPVNLLICFLLFVPLGLLFTSFILFMGIRAKTTAEAGTSLMPGLFLIITLGAFSMAPGIERMPLLPYVPVLNVSLAIRKLFGQQSSFFEILIAFFMTAGLAILMTWIATRLLDRESAIFKQG